jgi:hypothetical protein
LRLDGYRVCSAVQFAPVGVKRMIGKEKLHLAAPGRPIQLSRVISTLKAGGGLARRDAADASITEFMLYARKIQVIPRENQCRPAGRLQVSHPVKD